jgi:hypothetical protein
MKGLDRLPVFGGGSRKPSTGLFTKYPYFTAEPRMLDKTSRILSWDSWDNLDSASPDRYRWILSGCMSRRHLAPKAVLR